MHVPLNKHIIVMTVYTRGILLEHYISHDSTTIDVYYSNNSIDKEYTPGTHDSTTNYAYYTIDSIDKGYTPSTHDSTTN